MSQSNSKLALQTRIVQADDYIAPGFDSFVVPVARASTVVFPDLAALRGADWRDENQWRYGLHATPTSAVLAQRLAAIEGGTHTLLQPSGLAAITNVYLALLKTGDDVLIPHNIYSPNKEFGAWLQDDFGVSVRHYDPLIGADIAQLLQPKTRLIWLEIPGSVTMEVPDVRAITAVARAHGVVTALDNTYSAGLAFKPFEHGVDISVQALTKYQSGGSDVLMGATITADSTLYLQLKRARMRLGIGVSADDCSLILRSLPTMKTRFEAHGKSALALAQWLKSRPEMAAILHPQLADCPGHQIFQRDFSSAGGLFSVVFNARYSAAQIDTFIETLQLFSIGWSWGGAHSLAVPYNLGETRPNWPHRGALVRFYIGLEDEADLRADLAQALDTALA